METFEFLILTKSLRKSCVKVQSISRLGSASCSLLLANSPLCRSALIEAVLEAVPGLEPGRETRFVDGPLSKSLLIVVSWKLFLRLLGLAAFEPRAGSESRLDNCIGLLPVSLMRRGGRVFPFFGKTISWMAELSALFLT